MSSGGYSQAPGVRTEIGVGGKVATRRPLSRPGRRRKPGEGAQPELLAESDELVTAKDCGRTSAVSKVSLGVGARPGGGGLCDVRQ